MAAVLHLLTTLPAGIDDVAVADDLRAAGILVHRLSWHRRLRGPPGLVLGYASPGICDLGVQCRVTCWRAGMSRVIERNGS